MSRIDELNQQYKDTSFLYDTVHQQCVHYFKCGGCPFSADQIGDHCLRRKLMGIKDDILDQINNEHMRMIIEEQAKTKEEMFKAMMKVKQDDWEIVNIAYAEDTTTAVAFIKKGTPIKRNMELIEKGVSDHD